MIDARVLKDLKNFIEENIDPSMFPYCKGNSIRIGSTPRHNKKGYHIYDMRSKKHIETTFSKTAAVAIAKNLAKGQNVVTEVIDPDHVIEKITMMHVFLPRTVRITKDL